MKPAALLYLVAAALTPVGVGAESTQPCKFSLSSSGLLHGELYQFLDGQIRINGSYDAASFTIAEDGSIRDSHGFACLVTEPPHRQVRCDQARQPGRGFAINETGVLTWRGGADFFACPGLYDEYWLSAGSFLDPEGCLPVMLTASGCGSACPREPAETVWATRVATRTVTAAVRTLTVEATPGGCGGNYSFTAGVLRSSTRL